MFCIPLVSKHVAVEHHAADDEDDEADEHDDKVVAIDARGVVHFDAATNEQTKAQQHKKNSRDHMQKL